MSELSFWSVGTSPAIKKLKKEVAKFCAADVPILISGAQGSGRSSVARAIHRDGPNSTKPCAVLHCAANTDMQNVSGESQLGASEYDYLDMRLINSMGGGAIILEEVDTLSELGQARLQSFYEHYLQSEPKPENRIRFICTTTLNLAQQCAQGLFSNSLYYRIKAVSLQVPSVTEWAADMSEIAQQLLVNIARHHQCKPPSIDDEAMQKLCEHEWPGNLNELRNVLERALVLRRGTSLSARDIVIEPLLSTGAPLSIASKTQNDSDTQTEVEAVNESSVPSSDEGVSLEDYFQNFVLQNQHSMSETELARKLGISRKCLWERRQRFGISRKSNISKKGS